VSVRATVWVCITTLLVYGQRVAGLSLHRCCTGWYGRCLKPGA